jgi:hypothetical protein
MTIEEMQTYKRHPTLDMVKKASGVDLEVLEKGLGEIDSLLVSVLAKVNLQHKAAEEAFEKVDNVCPGCPDDKDGFMELTELEAEAEYDKYHTVGSYHGSVEDVFARLEIIKNALEGLTHA